MARWRWLRNDQADRDLTDEMRFHLDEEAQLRRDRGESERDARAHARQAFGNAVLVAETTRAMWGWNPTALLDDLRFAARRLRARPGTALAAVAMLGLGIGLATAMFTLVDALVLRPAPFKDPTRLTRLFLQTPAGDGAFNGRGTVSPPVFSAWRASPVFAEVAGTTSAMSVLDTDRGSIMAASARMSPNALALLGVHPSRGRDFEATDGRAGSDDRLLLSEDLWRTAFGADPTIIGRLVTIDGVLARVIGLMPAGFRFPDWNTVVWQPLDYAARPPALATSLPTPFVRLALGVPLADALKVARDIGRRVDPALLRPTTEVRTRPMAGQELDEYYQNAVPLLSGGVSLVLLVLCANVASLLLARLTARRREFGMCTALGASRARLLRQALAEHALLGLGGLAAGVGLAILLVALAGRLLPAAFLTKTLHAVALDGRALALAMGAGFVATLLAGVVPAWLGTSPGQASALTATERSATETRAARALTRTLLVLEVALACTLLVVSTLLVRSFVNLASVDRGLRTDGVVTAWVTLPPAGFPDKPSKIAVAIALEGAIRGLPGIARVALTNGLPPNGNAYHFDSDWRADDPGAKPVYVPGVNSLNVGPDYFELYGIRLLRGRTFQADEDPNDVIVGERLANLLWPGEDPVGRSFTHDTDHFRVVGVVHEVRFPSVDAFRDNPQYYEPFVAGSGFLFLNIRCAGVCPDEVTLRKRIFATAGSARIIQLGALSAVYQEELARPRGAMALGTTFALIAVLAAAGGLFSVLSYAVGRRRREFGIRLALGASPGRIRFSVLREGALVAGWGVAIGMAAALALAKVVSSLEYGVTRFDPPTYGIVVTLLAVTTLVASWRPARRAMRVDPADLLRDE